MKHDDFETPDYKRFEKPDEGTQYQSEYDIPSSVIQDPITRDTAPIVVRTLDLSVAGSVILKSPGRAFVGYFFATNSVNRLRAPSGLVNVAINNDGSNPFQIFPAKHNRGFRGSFTELTLSWTAQPNTSVDFVIHRSKYTPWMTDDASLGAAGMVTNVTSSAPLTSSGGATPNIAIPKATSLVDGFLSAVDWAIFNGKQNALTFPLATGLGGTGVNSTATFPASGVVVTEAGVETLTNKTIGVDQLATPSAPNTFNMANKVLNWQFTNPTGGMHWTFTGAADGHLLEIMQTGGNPGTSCHMLHIEASDPDPTMLHLVPGSATSKALKVSASGDVVTNPGRLEMDANGKQAWGSGAGSADVTLERSAAGVLKITGELQSTVAMGIASGGTGATTAAGIRTAISVAPTIQRFTSGSGTYTTPAGVKYIRVRMVGGGGGGGGSGTTGIGDGASGGNSTFGTTLLVANGGAGGKNPGTANFGGAGGTASLGSGPIGIAQTGSTGNGAPTTNTIAFSVGGAGGSSVFGGAGPSGYSTGNAAATNSGSGGSGGGGGTATLTSGGNGGGSGGYVEAIISAPNATYSYAVGASGGGGTAGTSGSAGGAGAAG
ncbi:MAG: hypothetical protein C5B47_00275, partial [Verrucomicrobia bacterium]